MKWHGRQNPICAHTPTWHVQVKIFQRTKNLHGDIEQETATYLLRVRILRVVAGTRFVPDVYKEHRHNHKYIPWKRYLRIHVWSSADPH